MKKIITIIGAALAVCSCSNMLDVYPHSAVAPESITENDLSALELGMYNRVQNNPPTESWILNDLLGGCLITSTSTPIDLINNTLTPLSSIVTNSYNGYFKALYQVNNVMGVVDGLPESEDRNRIKGTAHYFRALIYQYLVTRWGDVAICRSNTSALLPRDSASKVWDFIEEDLEQAVEYLSTSSSYYYVSKSAALALQARVKLYMGKNQEAAQIAESLITSKKYSLDSFEKIFRRTENSEIIFAFLNRTDESSNSFGNLFYSYAHPGKGSYTYRPSKETMNMYDANDLRKAISVDNSYGNNDVINKYSGGQGTRDPFNVSRLAEMYLISAEAQGRVNGLARLNELRAARGLDSVSPATDDAFLDAIISERRKELLAEGHMYYDLVRTGKAISVLGIQSHQQLLPIPSNELTVNSLIKQNPGY